MQKIYKLLLGVLLVNTTATFASNKIDSIGVENNKGKIVKIIFENGELYRTTDDGKKFELKAISKTKFHMMEFSPDIFYDFIMKDGKVEKYIMTQPELHVTRELIRK